MKPVLPAHGRGLEELVHELEEEGLVLQGEVLDPQAVGGLFQAYGRPGHLALTTCAGGVAHP
jgi:hypothetical protein